VLTAFLDHYKETSRDAVSTATDFDELRDLFGQLAGATFEQGLYRIHDGASSATSTALVKEAFPEVAKKVGPCFGYDWLGRQFSLDLSRRDSSGKHMVLMHEPGTSAVRGLPATVDAFHDRILIDQAEAALAVAYFHEWANKTKRRYLPLGRRSCVGYKIPLFLNGKDELSNLEVSDLEVYWSICGQLRNQAMGGRQIPSVHIGD
jgi:Domain of unknown function (DUF1851)